MSVSAGTLAIIVTLILFLLGQGGALIWLLSKLSSKIETLNIAVNELKKTLSSFVTKEVIDERLLAMRGEISENKRDIGKLVEAFDKHKDEARK